VHRGVIVLAPPWPRSGSANLIAAQATAHARLGARVLLLLTPLGRGFSRHKVDVWDDALSAMKFPGVETVSYPRAGRGRVRSYIEWLLAGRDDLIAISARYAASGKLPQGLVDFIASARIDLIHANHVFAILLAQRVARLVQEIQGWRPRILLDTHDVQSDLFQVARKKNPHSHRLDPPDDLLKTELALCSRADTLIHLTESDLDFFSSRLPDGQHKLILPTLHPDTEAELIRQRGAHHEADFDFIYVGNQHPANLATARWLLSEVLPLASPRVCERIRIVGTVGDYLKRRDPALSGRYQRLFVGEVPSLLGFYSAAKAVLAPATAGTGTSIKLIEALCAGKPVLTTGLGLRGLPVGELKGEDIHVHDKPADYAAAMMRLDASSAGAAASPANSGLYDRLFSNSQYFAALEHVTDKNTSESATPHRESAGERSDLRLAPNRPSAACSGDLL
jgi:glycosyltransferase involved in cell wall biosynthesis